MAVDRSAQLPSASARSTSTTPTPRRSATSRSEEHTSELQSLRHLVCRLLLEKKKEKHSRYRGKPCFSGHRVGDLRHGLPRPQNDGGSGEAEIRGAPGGKESDSPRTSRHATSN